ncbi:MAG: methyltransferase domain-containing protein [Rhodanobacter sp.]|nr:methyltransferase domain-containing protein [Rhodanobacter sp.]
MNDQNPADIDQLMAQIRSEVGEASTSATREDDAAATNTPSINELMRRVRVEVARRRDGAAPAKEAEAGNEARHLFPHWHSVMPELVPKQAYTLSDLLGYPDADFVQTAYKAVLRRPPDEAGATHYLYLLHSGLASKVEILGELRWSKEGMARGIHVDGLLLPYTVARWKRKRIIGPVIRWLHAFVKLGSMFERRTLVATSQERETHAVGTTLNGLSDALEHWKGAVERQIDAQPSNAAIQELRQELDAGIGRCKADAGQEMQKALGGYVEQLTDLRASFDSRSRDLLGIQQHVAHIERLLAAQPAWVSQEIFASELGAISEQLAQLRLAVDQQSAALEVIRAKPETPAPDLDAFYAAFEEQFRGDRDLVRRRALPYLEWVRNAGAGTEEAPVLDVGCGRGEWLELLRDNGLVGRGIDLNRIFIDACKGYGLDVTEGDAVKVLSSLPDKSVGAVTSMHLVEHLPFNVLIVMLDEMWRVLQPGGVLVLETPNPENLSVGHHTFYMDPTHRNPLPPETLRWIVEARGFSEATIERLSNARDIPEPLNVPEEVPAASRINTLLASLSIAPDYAIIAKKH